MPIREISPLDRLIAGFDTALRTVAAPTRHSPRPNPAADVKESALDDQDREHAAGLMRVNHAGEVAAQGLYQGHAAVARDNAIEAQMQQAAAEEYDHLAWCEQRLAFAIGAVSGVLGDKWSLGFIAETERQVVLHLESHLEGLPADDARSRAIVSTMRDEEDEHGKAAIAAGAAELPTPVKQLMKLTARIMTTAAYRL